MDNELKIIRDYIDGEKVVDIVKKHKVSSATVSKILKKYDIKTRYKTKDENNSNIYYEHLLFNLSFEDISKKYNLKETQVREIYRKERDQRLINDYQNESSIDELCTKYSLSNMGIYKILNKNNISRRIKKAPKRKFPEINPETKEKIIDDYYLGEESVYGLIDKYQISKHQLYSILYSSGSQLRTGFSVPNEIQNQIIEKYQSGATLTSLARDYKLSRSLISFIVKSR